MRFSFAWKLGIAITLLAVLTTGVSLFVLYSNTRSMVVEQMGNRLKDIGRAGAYLLDAEERKALAELKAETLRNARTDELMEKIRNMEDDGAVELLPAELSSRLHETDGFQKIVQSLRQVRASSRQGVNPLENIGASHEEASEDDAPTILYAYIYATAPGLNPEEYLMYLADTDYLPADQDGDGEIDYEGNPIGNLTRTPTEEMGRALKTGKPVAESNFTEDQWGDVVMSGFVPILDEKGEAIAVLGIDYDVKSAANKLNGLVQVLAGVMVLAVILAIIVAYIVARILNRPIDALTVGAERVADRDFSTRIEVKSKDEFGVLANTFNGMVTEIREYAQNLEALNSAYERFVPQEFLKYMGVENIINVKLGDQVQSDMTVLFSDIRSFTTLSETMTPKENFDFLNGYLGRVSPLIRSNNGFVDKFIGDAIMALFPRNADDAVRNAIQMIEQVYRYNEARQRHDYQPIRIGVGIHTGSLMLGTIGEERRMESTVISDAVNLASRLEGLTKSFGAWILISELVKNGLTPNEFQIRYLGKVRVKGKKHSVNVYECFDPDAPEVARGKAETREQFENAIALFQQGRFGDAAPLFREIVEGNPEDRPAGVYLERCEKYQLKSA